MTSAPERSHTRAEIVAIDKRRVWHPYTEMGSYIERTDPLVIRSARGPRIFDMDGRSYLDANSSWWVSALGHNHPRLVAALARQSQELCHCALAGITHEGAAMLAEELCAVAPAGLERVFYSDDGTTAVEVALKVCVQYVFQNGAPRRKRLVSLEHAFHGETVGATSLGGIEVFKRAYSGVLFDCIRVPSPANAGAYGRAFDELGRAIRGAADEIAGVVLEPCVQGAAGMWVYPADFLREAREQCTRHEIPLVLDEVFTGYGRTGPMWAGDHAGISPDVLCLGKGFSGGMFPMAATLMTQRLFDGFTGDRSRTFWYGHTYCGNPLGAAVAREVLRIYRDERIVEQARPKAAKIAQTFARLEREFECLHGARSLGMLGAIDLPSRPPASAATSSGPSAGYLADAGWRVAERARALGVYLRPLGNVVYVAPPLNIPDDDLDELLAKVHESIASVLT